MVSPNAAASALELVPNCNGVKEPTEFSIRFLYAGLVVEYSVRADWLRLIRYCEGLSGRVSRNG